MREKIRWCVQSGLFPLRHSDAKLFGVPVDDNGGQQVQSGDAEMLTLSRAISDLALPPNSQCIFKGVMCLALVQPNLGTALHVGIKQPFDDKQRPFDAPDFPQRGSSTRGGGIVR